MSEICIIEVFKVHYNLYALKLKRKNCNVLDNNFVLYLNDMHLSRDGSADLWMILGTFFYRVITFLSFPNKTVEHQCPVVMFYCHEIKRLYRL